MLHSSFDYFSYRENVLKGLFKSWCCAQKWQENMNEAEINGSAQYYTTLKKTTLRLVCVEVKATGVSICFIYWIFLLLKGAAARLWAKTNLLLSMIYLF